MRRNLSANVVNRKYGVRWKSDGKHRQKQKLEAAGGIDKIQTQHTNTNTLEQRKIAEIMGQVEI